MEEIALGLMSGTSADGVSAALGAFKKNKFSLIAYRTFPYPKRIQKKIRRVLELKTAEISQLDFELGHLFAKAAKKIIESVRLPHHKIKVIGSHGQTIYHGPRDFIPSTFQIGEASLIAQKTKIPVVSDFRPQAIAEGGEGAPLVPFFDHYFYRRGPVRAMQNIGGIANATIVGYRVKNPVAFDTGPGNCLIDLAIQKITRGRFSYDANGNWAKRGRVQIKWVQEMISHPYFKKRPPKSTGVEEFGEKFLNHHMGHFLKSEPYNVLATLTYFTAFSIFQSLRRFSPYSFKEIVVSGGGAKNKTLMGYLKELFLPIPVYSSETIGIPVQAKEPLAFAFFALRAIHRQANYLSFADGVRKAAVLGKIILPSCIGSTG